jgi:hypothetical protein
MVPYRINPTKIHKRKQTKTSFLKKMQWHLWAQWLLMFALLICIVVLFVTKLSKKTLQQNPDHSSAIVFAGGTINATNTIPFLQLVTPVDGVYLVNYSASYSSTSDVQFDTYISPQPSGSTAASVRTVSIPAFQYENVATQSTLTLAAQSIVSVFLNGVPSGTQLSSPGASLSLIKVG